MLDAFTRPGDEEAPRPDLPSREYVRLSIRDTGRGMEKDVLDRIFDPFFTTKKLGEGLGLGLSVARAVRGTLMKGIELPPDR